MCCCFFCEHPSPHCLFLQMRKLLIFKWPLPTEAPYFQIWAVYTYHFHMSRAKRKCAFAACADSGVDQTAHAQSDQGLRCSLPDTIDPINGEQRPGWDLAHTKKDVTPHILRMLDGIFSLVRPIYEYHNGVYNNVAAHSEILYFHIYNFFTPGSDQRQKYYTERWQALQHRTRIWKVNMIIILN